MASDTYQQQNGLLQHLPNNNGGIDLCMVLPLQAEKY
jgi:hypothetical protein